MKIRKIIAYIMPLSIILAASVSENILPDFVITANAAAKKYTAETYEDITHTENKIDSDTNANKADTIAIIGGADGPTAIFLTDRLTTKNLRPFAIAASSYV